MIGVQVNGKRVELDGPTPLLGYLRALGVDARAVAVEVNGEILQREAYAGCTLREGDTIEVVRMVAGGLRNREIAHALSISVGTVKAHLRTVFEKLGISSRMKLSVYARENLLV